MANECRGSLQLCAIRVSKLDATGLPLVGAGNMIVSDAPLSLEYSFEAEEGADLTVKNGCGTLKHAFRSCDQLKSVSLTLTLTELDAELLAFLTGGTTYISGGTTIGFQVASTDAACPNGVSVEAFTRRWNGDAADATRPWWMHGFPKTTWVIGSTTLDESILTVALDGVGLGNNNFYTGPTNAWVAPGLTNLYGFQAVTALPTVSCDPVALPGS